MNDGLARRLDQMRESSGRSLRRLERDLHVSDSSMSRYFSGQAVPPWQFVVDLCRIGGHDPRALRPMWEEANRGRSDGTRARSPLAPRNELPADVSGFIGRGPELEMLLELVNGSRAAVIDGMAGVGKTSLAVHAAHQLSGRFPDGQLYIDMHGFTPGREPMDPGDALRVLLAALDVAAGRIPETTEQRAALWRAELSRRKAVVLLDNVASADQVRPLLPGAGDSVAMITSRIRMVELDGVPPVSLEVFPEADAAALFELAVGDERAAREPSAASEVLRLCGHLPLAIRVAAARLRHRPSWTVQTLAERLRADLDQLDTAFVMSLRLLEPPQRRMFVLLGLMPGVDFDAYAAAALADVPLADARSILEDLVDAHLVQQPTADRYRLHDLLRQHARRASQEPEVDGAGALERLLDYYLHCASAASMTASYLLGRSPGPLLPPFAVPVVDTIGAALSWLDTEYENLRAGFACAVGMGLDRHVIGLPQALQPYFTRRGQTAEWNEMLDAALVAAQKRADPRTLIEVHADRAAARHSGGRTGEADADIEALTVLLAGNKDAVLDGRVAFRLGCIYRDRGQSRQALECSDTAARQFQAAGDPIGAATARAYLGHALIQQGRYAEAAEVARQALEIADSTTEWLPRFSGLLLLGFALAPAEPDNAYEHLRQALDLAKDFGHRHNELVARTGMAAALRSAGRHSDALAHHRQVARLVASLGEEQWALVHYIESAETYLRAGKPAVAARIFRRTLTICQARHLTGAQVIAHRGLAAALAVAEPADAARHAEAADATDRELAL